MMDGDRAREIPSGPKIPIGGPAGAAIYAALFRLSTRYGPGAVTISKERVAGGGYVYVLSNHEPPDKPARSIEP